MQSLLTMEEENNLLNFILDDTNETNGMLQIPGSNLTTTSGGSDVRTTSTSSNSAVHNTSTSTTTSLPPTAPMLNPAMLNAAALMPNYNMMNPNLFMNNLVMQNAFANPFTSQSMAMMMMQNQNPMQFLSHPMFQMANEMQYQMDQPTDIQIDMGLESLFSSQNGSDLDQISISNSTTTTSINPLTGSDSAFQNKPLFSYDSNGFTSHSSTNSTPLSDTSTSHEDSDLMRSYTKATTSATTTLSNDIKHKTVSSKHTPLHSVSLSSSQYNNPTISKTVSKSKSIAVNNLKQTASITPTPNYSAALSNNGSSSSRGSKSATTTNTATTSSSQLLMMDDDLVEELDDDDDDDDVDDDDDDDDDHSSSSSSFQPHSSHGSSANLMSNVNQRKRKQQLAKASKKHRLRQKDELHYLREKVLHLNNQLKMLTKLKDMECEHGSQWEQLARSQFLERQKAYQENAKLKLALEEQLKFAQALETMVSKKPRLTLSTDIDTEEWRLCKLGANLTTRHDNMHRIMARQYDALNGVFVRTGLFDPSKEIKSARIQTVHDDAVKIDLIRFIKVPCHYEVLAEATWQVCTGKESMDEHDRKQVTILEEVDENTLYCHMVLCKQGDTTTTGGGGERIDDCPFLSSKIHVQGFVIFKRFIEENRVVILWKSILEDELNPHDENVYISNYNGWITVEKGTASSDTNDVNVAHLKSFVERNPPSKAGKAMTVCELMKNLRLPDHLKKSCEQNQKNGKTNPINISTDEEDCAPGTISEYLLQSFADMARKHELAIQNCAEKMLQQRQSK